MVVPFGSHREAFWASLVVQKGVVNKAQEKNLIKNQLNLVTVPIPTNILSFFSNFVDEPVFIFSIELLNYTKSHRESNYIVIMPIQQISWLGMIMIGNQIQGIFILLPKACEVAKPRSKLCTKETHLHPNQLV